MDSSREVLPRNAAPYELNAVAADPTEPLDADTREGWPGGSQVIDTDRRSPFLPRSVVMVVHKVLNAFWTLSACYSTGRRPRFQETAFAPRRDGPPMREDAAAKRAS